MKLRKGTIYIFISNSGDLPTTVGCAVVRRRAMVARLIFKIPIVITYENGVSFDLHVVQKQLSKYVNLMASKELDCLGEMPRKDRLGKKNPKYICQLYDVSLLSHFLSRSMCS